MTQPRTLFPDRASTQKTPLGDFMYYKKPDGWIVPAQSAPNYFAGKLARGFTPLPQYGTFTPGEMSEDVRGMPFDAHSEMWRVIFQKNGAEAFPVDQIIAYNWHLSPPYAGVIFPQMEGVEVPELDCPECEILPCHDIADLATHLRIRHGYTRTDLRVYGDETDIKFDRKRTKVKIRPDLKEALAKVEEMAPTTLERGEPCGVDDCPWSPTKGKNYEKAMKGHRRMKHQSGSEPAQKGATDGIPEI
jgi:hypothetical protein